MVSEVCRRPQSRATPARGIRTTLTCRASATVGRVRPCWVRLSGHHESSQSCARAGPVSASYRAGGGGSTDWLFPFVDGAPPIGWSEASPYLVLPVLLVLAQYASSAIISPIDPNQEGARTQRILITVLPLTFSWIALSVPSGLSLYYLSNSVFTSALQVRLPPPRTHVVAANRASVASSLHPFAPVLVVDQ